MITDIVTSFGGSEALSWNIPHMVQWAVLE